MSSKESNLTLNDEIVKSITEDFISNIHRKKDFFNTGVTEDIYSFSEYCKKNICNLKIIGEYSSKSRKEKITAKVLENIVNELSKQQQILEQETLKNTIKELGLKRTSNSSLYSSLDGKYYKINKNQIIEQKQIINVDKDGNYTVLENLLNGNDSIATTYDTSNKPISIKIINAKGHNYQSERYVAKKLNLKKEYVNKYKLHGYSGNASNLSDVAAAIGNFISTPHPSGCYADNYYRFFKWNKDKHQFEVNLRQGVQPGAPLVSDYEIKENTVIRTDYDGFGAGL